MEDVEHPASLLSRPRSVGDPAGNLVGVTRPELVVDAIDLEDESALQDEPELLVRMVVSRDGGVGLEVEEVEHHGVAEERLGPYPWHELEAVGLVEARDAHQPATTGFVSSPIRSTETVTVSPGFR